MLDSGLRVGVVGLGPWGRNLARVLLGTPGAQLVACCDSDEEALRLRGPWERPPMLTLSFAELLRHDLDAVIIATPPHSHAELTVGALAEGRHVFVEKPMACSSLDAARMAAAADRARRVLMVGHILLFHPRVMELRELIARGHFGTVRRLATERVGGSSRHGNAWWSLAPHDLSLALALIAKPPISIRVTRAGSGDRVLGRLDFSDDTSAEILVGSEATTKTRRVELIGTRGSAVLDDARLPAELTLHGDAWIPGRERAGSGASGCTPLEVEMAEFVRAALSGARVQSDGHFGVQVTRLLEAGEKSLAQGGSVIALGSTTGPSAVTPAADRAAYSISPLVGLEALA